MSLLQVVVLAAVALIAALVTILLVPRECAQPFELVIWLATWLVAGLSAWLVRGAVDSLPALNVLALLPIANMAVVPLALGAFGGALVLTVPLWLMDRLTKTDAESGYEQE